MNSFAESLDGYSAGPRGPRLFEWFFATRAWREMHGYEGDTTGVDNEWAQRGMQNVGAWILGRNMFGPVRGLWPDESWSGWWGEEPPYRVPTFVLAHYPRKSVEMKGGTTFHFVTEAIHAALERAKDAAKDKDVRIGGGVATVQQYLRARLVDELLMQRDPVGNPECQVSRPGALGRGCGRRGDLLTCVIPAGKSLVSAIVRPYQDRNPLDAERDTLEELGAGGSIVRIH